MPGSWLNQNLEGDGVQLSGNLMPAIITSHITRECSIREIPKPNPGNSCLAGRGLIGSWLVTKSRATKQVSLVRQPFMIRMGSRVLGRWIRTTTYWTVDRSQTTPWHKAAGVPLEQNSGANAIINGREICSSALTSWRR